jgi:hypothetical protein
VSKAGESRQGEGGSFLHGRYEVSPATNSTNSNSNSTVGIANSNSTTIGIANSNSTNANGIAKFISETMLDPVPKARKQISCLLLLSLPLKRDRKKNIKKTKEKQEEKVKDGEKLPKSK